MAREMITRGVPAHIEVTAKGEIVIHLEILQSRLAHDPDLCNMYQAINDEEISVAVIPWLVVELGRIKQIAGLFADTWPV